MTLQPEEKLREALERLVARHQAFLTASDGFMGNQADAYNLLAKRFEDWNFARDALASYCPDGVGGEGVREAIIEALDIMCQPGVRTMGDIADAILARLPALPVEGGAALGSLRPSVVRQDKVPEPDCNVTGSRAWWLVRYVAGADRYDLTVDDREALEASRAV